MKKSVKIAGGILTGTTLGIIFGKIFGHKTKIEKRSRQLSCAIDKKLEADVKDLEETRKMLEAQLEKVNAKIELLK